MGATGSTQANAFSLKPLRDSTLLDVPGIGEIAVAKLGDANIDSTEKLMGQFMVLGRDVGRMTGWLRDVCCIRTQDASRIAQALDEKAARMVSV